MTEARRFRVIRDVIEIDAGKWLIGVARIEVPDRG